MIRIVPLLSITLVSASLLAACDNDPAEGKTKAQVAEAASAAPQANPAKGAVKYTFSQGDSQIEFVGAKVTRKHDGSFKTFSGTVEIADGDPTKGRVSAEIDTASVVSDDEKLTKHLKSADFFDVEKHPKARFTSTKVIKGGGNGATHTVTGNLELHGVTKAITFPAIIRTTDDNLEIDAEFAIDRKDFEIVYPGMPDDLIKNDVLIRLKLRPKKQQV